MADIPLVAETMPGMVEQPVRTVEGVTDVTIDLVFEPECDPSRMSDVAMLELKFTGMTPRWGVHARLH